MQYIRRLLDTKDGLKAAGLESSDDAVTITTIHKSKGLQYPIVFVASCATPFNRDDLRAPLMFDRQLGAAAKIYHPETAELRETVTRSAIIRQLETRATEEQMRLLYVALTRAQERLYITAKLQGLAENAQDNARVLGGNCRYSVMQGNSYLTWILAALAQYKGKDAPLWKIRVRNADKYRHPHVVKAKTSGDNSSLSAVAAHEALANEYRTIIEKHKTFEDPHALLRTLPTKAAASKLRVAMLDGTWFPEEFEGDDSDKSRTSDPTSCGADAKEMLRRRIELMQRNVRPFEELMRESGKATAAERGTATHLFLQQCDFSRLNTDTVEQEISRLTEARLLPTRAAEILHRDQLTALCQSDLLPLCKNARRIWREQHFDRFIPYTTLTKNQALASQLGDYTLYVQGSIDLIVEDEAGKLWLLDYKTDRLRDEKTLPLRDQLLADHADQLRIYADAVFELFGRRPDHVGIYALSQGCIVDLTDAI